jgi:Carboxypeptidase regulatory-like domain
MKNMMRSIPLLLVAFAASAIYGGQPAPGVAGVDVVVKQIPSKRAVTDARGNFAFDALPPGSYTLTVRGRKANEITSTTASKVTVAGSYLIKVEGTKRSVNQSGFTSDRLLAGVDIAVEVGSGAKVRGQVLAGSFKKMVWIAAELGSHMPGHWVDADSKEVAAHNTVRVSTDDMRNSFNRNADPHQEGFRAFRTGPTTGP